MLAALDDETRDWVQALKNKVGGPCCDTADGFPVEIDGWDMAGTVDDTSGMSQWQAGNARSGYRVRLADGKWHDVPNFALIDPKNQQAWLCCGVATPARDPSDLLLPSRSGGLSSRPNLLPATEHTRRPNPKTRQKTRKWAAFQVLQQTARRAEILPTRARSQMALALAGAFHQLGTRF